MDELSGAQDHRRRSGQANGPILSNEGASSTIRTIVTLTGIAIIVVLGGIFWTSLGALAAAWNDALVALPAGRSIPLAAPDTVAGPIPTFAPTPFPTAPPAVVAASPTPPSLPTALPTSTPAPTLTPVATSTSAPTPATTSTPVAAAATSTAEPADGERIPWVLLPQPVPDSRVAPGTIVLEARGRGDAPVVEIRLELDGAAVPASFDQRGDSIARGSATVTVAPGRHAARAVVVDARGRSGSFRWNFEVGE